MFLGLAGLTVPAGELGRACLGGQPVQEDEFTFYADQVRTDVASRFMRENGIRQSDGFWTTPINGVSPEEILEKETLRAIARTRALQQLAVDRGLLEQVMDYRQLVAEFHAENQRRKEMKERGEIFYGPVQFRQDIWFKVWFEQLFKALQKAAVTADGPSTDRGPAEARAKAEIERQLEARVLKLIESPNP
jgi:hypothetical protein